MAPSVPDSTTASRVTANLTNRTASLLHQILSNVSNVVTTLPVPPREHVAAFTSTQATASAADMAAPNPGPYHSDNDGNNHNPSAGESQTILRSLARTVASGVPEILESSLSSTTQSPFKQNLASRSPPINPSPSSSSSVVSTTASSLYRTLKTMVYEPVITNSSNASLPRSFSTPSPVSPPLNISTESEQGGLSGPFGGVSAEVPGYVDISSLDFGYNSFENFTDTMCGWNTTALCGSNGTNMSAHGVGEEHTYRLWAVVLVLFPLFTIFGNALVVMSVYKERSLRTVTNYFIVSLALADVLVSVLVMPLAVYVEINSGVWSLGNSLCDAWVAFDVLASTASILNLTAISVDRFIAVTQPIKYAKHKNSNRVYLMLALVWIVSIAIASPIALGMNYSDRREQTPELCVFYNSDFLIYSSMGSFYIPCIIMLFLYWRIFRAIHLRARKARMHKKTKVLQNKTLANVIENTAQTGRSSSSSQQQQQDNNASEVPARELLPQGRSLHAEAVAITEETTTFTNMNAADANVNISNSHLNTTESDECEALKSPISDDAEHHVIPNDKSTEFMLSPVSEDSPLDFHPDDSGYSAPTTVEVVTTYKNKAVAGSPKRTFPRMSRRNNHRPTNSALGARLYRYKSRDESPKKSVTKFNFHLRHSKKKKEKTSSRRERKATKTLAIVLGVFLFCWVPFFTVNIMNAICIRYNLFETNPECNIPPELFSFFVWLGYINSFLNPVIYTIFNNDFRRAFKKLLTEPCK